MSLVLGNKYPIPSQKIADAIANSNSFPFFAIRSKNYVAKYETNGKMEFIRIVSSYIEVVGKEVDFDNGNVRLLVRYNDGIADIEQYFDRSILTRQGLDQLTRLGVAFNTVSPSSFLTYLQATECSAPVSYTHMQLGWGRYNDHTIFKSYQLYSDDAALASTYSGTLDLQPHGDAEKWMAMYKDEVRGNIPLTIVLLSAFASPLLGYLNQTHDIGSVLFNLCNVSSKGKTTAAMLAASVFGNPVMDKGTMITFNATGNALISFASQCNAHPIILDEAAIYDNPTDIRRQLYTLCSGRDKLRLNSSSELKEVRTFSSCIISTAEFNLVDESSPNGIKVRVFELDDTFTRSAQNSDAIKTTVMRNYGYAGEQYIEYIIKNKLNDIERDYARFKSMVLQQIPNKQELTERVISKLAILVLAAHYCNCCFGWKIRLKEITGYIRKLEMSVRRITDQTQYLLDCIAQEVGKNILQFYCEETENIFPARCIGKLFKQDDRQYVAIYSTTANDIFKRFSIENAENTMKEAKKNGKLLTEKDRLTKRVKINGQGASQKCYIFDITEYELINDGKNTKKSAGYSPERTVTRYTLEDALAEYEVKDDEEEL